MRVLGICALALTASAANTCGLTDKTMKYYYLAAPAEGAAANGIDRHMDHTHCQMDSEGATKECEITKCVGNMVASGKTTLLCNGNGQVVPKPGSNIKCNDPKGKAAFGVPQLHKIDPFRFYFRFFAGTPSCSGNYIPDVSAAVWPLGPNGSKISTVAFGTGVVKTIRTFPGPNANLDKSAWGAGGALDFVKAEAHKTKKEYLVATYKATMHMQKFWDACKAMRDATGYYVTDDNAICIPLGATASMHLQPEWAYKGGKTPCSKTDIAWGTWWMEYPVVGKLNIGSIAFIITPAFLCCNLLVCLVGICACCFCCARAKN